MSILRRIAVAACVYFIWNEKRSHKDLLTVITNNVRMKMASLTVKSSRQVDEVCKQWQVTMNRKKDDETIIMPWNNNDSGCLGEGP